MKRSWGQVVTSAALCLVAVCMAGATALGATMAEDVGQIRITEVDTSGGTTIRFGFTRADDSAALPDIELEENGKTIESFSVYSGPTGQYESEKDTVVVLAIDASESMAGAKFANAKAAAHEFLDKARERDEIGLVSFGDGATVEVDPTTDHRKVADAIDGMTISNGTATYDAVVEAADMFPENGSRNVILLMSDGAELRSSATFDEAVDAAKQAKASIVSVGIVGRGFEPEVLADLSTPTGGSYHEVARTDDLEELYASLGDELLRSYWVEYETLADGTDVVEIELVADGYPSMSTTFKLETLPGADNAANPTVLPAPKAAVPPDPLVEMPSGLLGRVLVAIPFGLALASWYLLHKSSSNRLTPARIEPYVGTEPDPVTQALANRASERGSLVQRLFAATERRIGTSSRFDRYRQKLDAAALPLRPVELFWARIGAGLAGASLGLLFAGVIGLVIGAVAVSFAPLIFVNFRGSRRRKKFDAQLADVLATMASSLKAGHSFNQSMNAVIKESASPVSDEFQRAMTEASLGLPLDEALDQMATRLGSADLRFVVTTVSIQRTVGGSLAEILDMVGDTVRGRQQFRKKVQALTSMGRASMWVLLAMPVVMAGLLTFMNGAFMEPLWTTSAGHMMIGAALFLMFLGYMACKKIVQVAI